jgi:hypothetical protein
MKDRQHVYFTISFQTPPRSWQFNWHKLLWPELQPDNGIVWVLSVTALLQGFEATTILVDEYFTRLFLSPKSKYIVQLGKTLPATLMAENKYYTAILSPLPASKNKLEREQHRASSHFTNVCLLLNPICLQFASRFTQ